MTANLEPGEYDFHCAVHPFMTGQIIVLATAKEEQEEESSSPIIEPDAQVIPDEPQIEREPPSIDFDIL